MHNLKLHILFLTSLFYANITYSQNTEVRLPGTQVMNFTSAINGEDYALYVALPSSYSDTTKRYPVYYVLDGEWDFAMANAICGSLVYEGSVPEMIVVGIGWRTNGDANRNKDFSSVAVPGDSNTGGAAKFLNVLKTEIIGRINSGFRTNKNDNILSGGSLGGFFTLYALFHEPALINRYIACSPSLQWDDEVTFKTEKSFAEQNHILNKKIFISSSETEESLFPVTNFQRFISQLRASNYKGLALDTLVVKGMSHASGGPYAIARGLQFVFNKPELILDTSLLNQFVGKYEQDWVITRKDSSLYISVFGGNAKLYAETNYDFYVKGMPLICKFQKNGAGKVRGCNVTFFAPNATFLKKLD